MTKSVERWAERLRHSQDCPTIFDLSLCVCEVAPVVALVAAVEELFAPHRCSSADTPQTRTHERMAKVHSALRALLGE